MEASVVVDRPPVRHRSIKLLIDRQLGRPTDLIAQLRVLVVQPLELGRQPMPCRPNRNIEQLGSEVLLVLAGQVVGHRSLLILVCLPKKARHRSGPRSAEPGARPRSLAVLAPAAPI